MTIEQLLEQMRDQGLKVTPQRRLIAKYIAESKDCCISAQSLLDSIRLEQPDISMDTIYRSLKILCSIGMLYRIEKPGKGSEYEILAGKHLHYMICLGCGMRETVDCCAVSTDFIKEKSPKGFRLTGHKFELYGFCQDCDKGCEV